MDPSAYVTQAELANRLAEINQRTVVNVELPWWFELTCCVFLGVAAVAILALILGAVRRVRER